MSPVGAASRRNASTLRMGATWLHGLGGRDGDLRIPLSHTDGHMLIVGVTGAGKTRTFDLLVTHFSKMAA